MPVVKWCYRQVWSFVPLQSLVWPCDWKVEITQTGEHFLKLYPYVLTSREPIVLKGLCAKTQYYFLDSIASCLCLYTNLSDLETGSWSLPTGSALLYKEMTTRNSLRRSLYCAVTCCHIILPNWTALPSTAVQPSILWHFQNAASAQGTHTAANICLTQVRVHTINVFTCRISSCSGLKVFLSLWDNRNPCHTPLWCWSDKYCFGAGHSGDFRQLLMFSVTILTHFQAHAWIYVGTVKHRWMRHMHKLTRCICKWNLQ